MKKTWQIWLVFVLCLAIVTPAMVWLSVKTMQLDALRERDRQDTEVARQEAVLQERINSALYRLDLKLLPLVAQEAARPHYLYNSFYQVTNPAVEVTNNAGAGQLEESAPAIADIPSPLLYQLPEFVILHFQIQSTDEISSPQRPLGKRQQLAMSCCGLTQESIDEQNDKVSLVKNFCSYDELLPRCEAVSSPQNDSPNQNESAQSMVYQVPQINGKPQIDFPEELLSGLANEGTKLAQQRSTGNMRGNEEFNRRRETTQQIADQQWQTANAFDNQRLFANFNAQDQANLQRVMKPSEFREGVMQPMWVQDKLILARRVESAKGKEAPVIQCCWLDWDKIQKALREEIQDLLPKVEFQPVKQDTEINVGTALTTLPVQLVVDSPTILSSLAMSTSQTSEPISGLKMSLIVAWCGMGLATLAVAFLLHGVLRLSERRATFVSAVTHELRTPLTTFRMYAEMLAEKMVPPHKQQDYAHTLRVQADRLSHLVENVLQFARLERGAQLDNDETVSVHELLHRFSNRLDERVREADMELVLDVDAEFSQRLITTKPSTIEQVLFNLVDNACKYAKPCHEKQVHVIARQVGRLAQFAVRDFGPGVAPKYKKRMFQPFCKSDQDAANTAPGVGLGLALCQRMAASLNGTLFLKECDRGAMFVLQIPLD